MTNNGNVLFKYSIGMPTNVTAGTFYWVWINTTERNQLFFSPTTEPEKLMRLDNIISGNGGGSSKNVVYLADIIDEPEKTETEEGKKWNNSDWEKYIKDVADGKIYGTLTGKPYTPGCIIICGSREFICKTAATEYKTVTVDGVEYYVVKDTTDTICVDEDNNKIDVSKEAPENAAVDTISTTWEMFGNLSENIMENIVKHTTLKSEDDRISIVEGTNENGGKEYSLKLIISENNPVKYEGSDGVYFEASDEDALVTAGHIVETVNTVVDYVNTNVTALQSELTWVTESPETV